MGGGAPDMATGGGAPGDTTAMIVADTSGVMLTIVAEHLAMALVSYLSASDSNSCCRGLRQGGRDRPIDVEISHRTPRCPRPQHATDIAEKAIALPRWHARRRAQDRFEMVCIQPIIAIDL
jgi:hypothetical protein